jgi:hypothetical protein
MQLLVKNAQRFAAALPYSCPNPCAGSGHTKSRECTMAVILILAGSVVGFMAGIASMVVFDASVLQSLGVWVGTGIFMSGLGLALSLAPRRAPLRRLETA